MQKKPNEHVIRIILHILAWVLVIGLPIFLVKRFRMSSDFLLTYYAFAAIHALIFYTNYLFLVPGLFFKKKRFRYYIAVLALVSCFYFISDFANRQINNRISGYDPGQFNGPSGERQVRRLPPLRPRIIIAVPNARLIGYASSSLFIVFLSLGLRVLERQEEMEKTKLNAELAILKNQINPHFFFNTLNNIYSLIGINTVDSQKAVLKLSKLMRYLLYESERGNVKLSNEIDFMKSYFDLMKLRLNNKVGLKVDFPDKYEDVSIPPLLFIPYVENAFKHGVSYRGKSFINVGLSCSGRSLEFTCINSISNGDTSDKNSGIGLENARKRLNLLFPSGHDLRIKKDEKKFEVFLKIEFK